MADLVSRTYAVLPVGLQNLLLTAYGWNLARVRCGSLYRKLKAECTDYERMPPHELAAIQEQRLLETIRHAYRYVPYYRRTMDRLGLSPSDFHSTSDLGKLPTIDKEVVRHEGADLVSRAVPIRRMQTSSSGGTTGTSVTLWADPAGLQTHYAIFHGYQWRWAGVEYGQEPWVMVNGRMVVPLRQRRPPFWRYNAVAKQYFFSCFHIREETIPIYLEKMAQIKPALLHLYPSNAWAFADYMKRHRLEGLVHPRAIICTSETLYPEIRSLVEEQFQAKVYNHYIGDDAVQICECEKGGLHLVPFFGYVEFEPLADSDIPRACQMIVTGLANRGTVLIRHRIGDLAVPSKQPCTCGRTLPTVDTLVGRTGDVVYTPSGNMINISNLTDVFKHTPNIRRCQFVQSQVGCLLARMEVTSQFSTRDERHFRKEVAARVGLDMELSIEMVDSLPLTGAGKLRFVVNEVHQHMKPRST